MSSGEKKVIVIGSAAFLLLVAVLSLILGCVRGCGGASEPITEREELVPAIEELNGVFPMKYYQADRRNYISADGSLVVIGAAWNRSRLETGLTRYPIAVVRKVGEVYQDPYILWCDLVDGAVGGDCVLKCGYTELSDVAGEASFSYAKDDELINVRLFSITAE